MKKILPLLLLTVFAITTHAQTDDAMLKWLNGHVSAINLAKSESNGEIQGSGIKDKRAIQELKFTKFGVETIGSLAYQKVNMVRLYFLKATIDNELLVLLDRGNNTVSLYIADAAVREKYKEVFTRFAYTRINTNETDLPVYNSDKVDTKAVFPGGEEAWMRFVGKHFFINPAIKYEVPPGRYEGTISFVVTKDSLVKDFTRAVNSPKGIQEAMLYVASKMPRWVPATLNGKNVSSTATIKMTIVVPVLTNSFEDQILKVEALKYQDINFNTPNYTNSNPGYLGLTPLNLEDNKTPDQKKDNAVREPISKNPETSTDIKFEKWITEPVAYFTSVGAFKDELAVVSKEIGSNERKWGYINRDGKIIIPVKFDEALDFSYGFACVSLNNKRFFITRTGKVVPTTWDYVRSFSEGLAVVEKNELRGCIDTTGKIVLAPKFFGLDDFYDGLAAFANNKGKWGYIDKTGKVVVEAIYEGPGHPQDGMRMMTLMNPMRKLGFLTKDGKEAVSFIYDDAKNFSGDLASVSINKKYGFINKEGKAVIPFQYDYAYSFVNGLAEVKKEGRYGLINKKGEIVVPIRYGSISGFYDGLARITTPDGKKGFINATGEEIITAKYDEAGAPQHGLICVALNGSWGYIDMEGNTKIPLIYGGAFDFVGGLAEVISHGKTIVIDRDGNKWVPKK